MSMGDLSIFWVLFQFLSSETLFLPYRSFTCLVRVTPTYFILFVTIEKGVISLIPFSASLSFEYRKVTDLLEVFYIQTLCWSCLSGLGVLWWNVWGHLSILSYHLQTVILWLLPIQFESLWPLLMSNCFG